MSDFFRADGTYNGYYYIAVDEPLSQTDAQSNCQGLGTQLASITTDEENSFIRNLTSTEYCGTG